MPRHSDYDTVVIGSGAGGLTAALILAQQGQKVLVLEQHYLPGGWCHSFSLSGFQFSPGVHYIGKLQEGGSMRRLYESLGVADDLTFLELNPDGYDHVVTGKERFDIPAGRERYEGRLVERFPSYKKGIAGYFDAVERIGHELEKGIRARDVKEALTLPARIPTVLGLGFRTLDSVLDKYGLDDPMLRTILSVQAGDHGVGPKRAPFVMHAGIVDHYLEGGWYPKGGAKALPKAFLKHLRRAGGEIQVKAPVDRILVEGEGSGRRAVGVRLRDGSEITARQVVSNADPAMTFTRLVGDEHLSTRLKLRLRATKYSISALSLFLAVDMDTRAAGLDSGNLWYNKAADVQAAYDFGASTSSLVDEIPGFFLTDTTLKDPGKRKDGLHTLEMFSFTTWDAFSRYKDTHYGSRPESYQDLKRTLTQRMLGALDEVVPGIADRVVFQSLGTPLTNHHYVAATEGNIYGIEKSRHQIGPFAFGVKSEIPGLFLCGASTIAHGVAGATMSGVAAACSVLKCGRKDVLVHKSKLTTLPCEHPETWPDAEAPPDDVTAIQSAGSSSTTEAAHA